MASIFSVAEINLIIFMQATCLIFMLKPCDFMHVPLICSLQNYKKKSHMFDTFSIANYVITCMNWNLDHTLLICDCYLYKCNHD